MTLALLILTVPLWWPLVAITWMALGSIQSDA